MSDTTQKLAIIVTAQDLASGKLGKVRQELAQMGPGGRLAAVGIGSLMGVANKGEQALGHLQGRITSLAGPLGLIGLGTTAFGLGGALEQGIGKASALGLEVETLTGLTGQSAESMSALAAVFEKFGISADRAATIVGFTEKTLGALDPATGRTAVSADKLRIAQEGVTRASDRLNLAETRLHTLEGKRKTSALALATAQDAVKTAEMGVADAQAKLGLLTDTGANSVSKLLQLQQQYGVQLTDSSGKALDFGSVLNNVADYYKSSAAESDKAHLAAQLFGRGYAEMIPILKLGSQGIKDAEAEAAKLGLTLTATNAADLVKYRESMRTLGDAVGGVELQLGLAFIPAVKDAADAVSHFLENGGRDQIVGLFKRAIDTGRQLVGFITGSVVPTIQTIGGAASAAWNTVPEPLRELITKGVIADRTIKFLFGMSPIHFVLDTAESAIGKAISSALGGSGFFGRGSIANPMIVKDISGILGGAGGGPLGTLEKDATKTGIISIVVAALADLALPAIVLGTINSLLGQLPPAQNIKNLPPVDHSVLNPMGLQDPFGLPGPFNNNPGPSKIYNPTPIARPYGPPAPFVMGPAGNLTPAIDRLTGAINGLGGKEASATAKFSQDVRDAINHAANAGRDDIHAQLKGQLDANRAIQDGNNILRVYTTGTALQNAGSIKAADQWIGRNIEILTGLQNKFLAVGDTATARKLGEDIAALKAKQSADVASLRGAITHLPAPQVHFNPTIRAYLTANVSLKATLSARQALNQQLTVLADAKGLIGGMAQ